jgi:signal transduction histidine kinase
VFKRIRTKLVMVLTIPLLILVSIAYLEVSGSLSQSRSVGTQADLATVAIGPGGLVSGLQTERNQAGLQVLGFDSKVALGVANATEARLAVDGSATAFRASTSSRGAATVEAYRAAFAAFGRIHALRAQLDAFQLSTGVGTSEKTRLATSLFDGYTTIIQAFFDANSHVAANVANSQLRSGIELLDVTLRQQESESLAIRDAFLATTSGGLAASGQMPQYAADLADFHNWTRQMSVLGTGTYDLPVHTYIKGLGFTTLDTALVSYLNGTPVDPAALLAASNPGVPAGQRAKVIPGAVLQTQLAALVKQQADHLKSAAQQRLLLFSLLAVLATAIVVGIVVLATRSITRPLRVLATQAHAMATTTLPTAVQSILDTAVGDEVTVPKLPPITVSSSDEVGDVAAALTTVQDAALELAVEQAVLRRNIADSFVNLGRRNQNLLGRQLDFITALENKETDPGKLDDLFRLDHLATRMRRNAESLLVLAGLESPRQWSAPVAVGDIMRASLAEVEDYRRVSVRQVDPAAVPGSAAADVAHIIAELVENAIASSPPDTQVEVYGRSSARDYLISVVDRGVGMIPADLQRANLRLAGGESFTVAPSRYLGHYVAGRLAARYGINVMLQDSDNGGIKARILLPAALLDQLAQPRNPAPPPPEMPPPPASAPPQRMQERPVAAAPSANTGPSANTAPSVSTAPSANSAPSARRASPAPPATPTRPASPAPPAGPARAPAPLAARAPAPPPAPSAPVPVPAAAPGAPAAGNGRGPAPVAGHGGVLVTDPAGPRAGNGPAPPPLTSRRPPGEPQTSAPPPPPAPARSQSDMLAAAAAPAAASPAQPVSQVASLTAGGLTRRVPGASITDEADDQSLRRTVEEDENEGAGDTSAHEVYRMLSNLWTDTSTKTPTPARTDHPERGRSD